MEGRGHVYLQINGSEEMAKQKLTPEQYQELKRFLDFFSNRYFGLKNDISEKNKLLAALDEMEKTAPARAALGLAMMINDCIEMASGWSLEKISDIDAELKSSGIITLTELRRQYSTQYAKVVKRGCINNEEEYYLLKGVLDGGALEMTTSEQETLTKILDCYERSVSMDPGIC